MDNEGITEAMDFKEATIELHIKDTNAQFITPKIKGCLEGAFVSSDRHCELKIESELGYVIYHNMAFQGKQYLPFRVQAVDNKGDRIGYSFEEYCLNEKLIVTAIGQNGTKVKIILRID